LKAKLLVRSALLPRPGFSDTGGAVADQQGATWETLARRLGVASSESQRRGLETFWSLLLTWNARINLTGAQTRDDLVGEHLPDALAMASLVPPEARVLDVGSGGGLPAIPFGLLRPDVRLTLVEPRAKRVAFLRTAVRTLGLSAEVAPARVEDLEGASFDVAGSRATFAPVEWLEKARALAPRVLVFAARRGEVGADGGRLEAEVGYETGRGHARWVGLLRST
jgi:16S rRNA (guanine(527)-N(7))-methyltransferase RsmG